MRNAAVIAVREFCGYFATPLAYVFLAVFLAANGAFGFFLGGFFDRGRADLSPFFNFHPWLFLLLIPAVSMRLWAEERKTGTIEFLMTLPVSTLEAVVGKFAAAWAFTALALALTAPMWFSVHALGAPDDGVVAASYLASFLTAGAFLAIGCCLSAAARNQVTAFILTAAAAFIFTMSGSDLVLSALRPWAPDWAVETVRAMGVLGHYERMLKGLIDVRSLIYFISLTVVWLAAAVLVVDMKKAD
ncbi:MAG: ABC transporter permease subunit [Rhodospirillales bacterium]